MRGLKNTIFLKQKDMNWIAIKKLGSSSPLLPGPPKISEKVFDFLLTNQNFFVIMYLQDKERN